MRPEKASIVSDLAEKLKQSPYVLVTDYQHMKVADFTELRNRLEPAGAEMHVVKNNFLKRAMADSGFPDVGDQLIGQTAVVTGERDLAPVAKILETLADLPPREILQAQLLGLLLSPATKLVRLLNEPASALARLLNGKAQKEGKPAEASA